MGDVAKCTELLKALQSSNNQERQQAEKLYQQAKQSEPDSIAMGMMTVVAEQSVDAAVRSQAAVLLRQMMSVGLEKDFVLARMQPQNRQEVAAGILRVFEGEATQKIQRKIGDVIAKLASSCCNKDDQRGWIVPGQAGWPGLLPMAFRMANAQTNANKVACENAIRLLKDLIITLQKEVVVGAQAEIGAVLQNAFACEDMKVKVAGFLLVCEIVETVEKKDWAPLLATASVLNQILEHLAQAQNEDLLNECMQALTQVVQVEPDFFKSNLQSSMQPAKFMSVVIKTREGLESGIRGLCLEWLVSYCERKPKWIAKSLPAFAHVALECCMDMMYEVDDTEADLKAWAERMDDEEGEEDADELFHSGEESIDRVVQAVGMECVAQALFGLIGKFASQDAWQAKHAALAAVKQTVEYAEERDHINEMAKLLMQHADHPHPRVRHTALHAIGQLANDQAPQFQEDMHATVIPLLLAKMDDQVDRVAAMAMSAFVSFGEELDNTLMASYANNLMNKLVGRLQTTGHRMVQEESITSIAVIAGVIEKDFSQYYDGIMPLLKQLVLNAKGEKENRLRGKAFECMSLLGLAVGKEKFLPDADQAITEMMKTPLEADDMQREYIKEAAERVCKCLKGDFKKFLPNMLQGIFASFKIEMEQSAGDDDDDDEEYIQLSTTEGKMVKVKSSKLEEMGQSLSLLQTFCTEMEGAYRDFVPATAEALIPILTPSQDTQSLFEDARGQAFKVWALLIKCVTDADKINNGVAAELLRTLLQRSMAGMEEDDDPDTLRDAVDGIGECIKNCGPGVLNAQEILGLVEKFFILIDKSFARSSTYKDQKKDSVAGAPPELQDDDEEDNDESDEDNLRQTVIEAMGHIMEVGPAEFLPCLTECSKRIAAWLQTKQNKVLALFLGCELIKHLKEKSEPAWPVLMPAVMQSLVATDAEERIPAAYAVNLASSLESFSQAAGEAFRRLAQVVGGPRPKKSEERAKVALDNATSALLALAMAKGPLCPPEIKAWQLIVNRLPIKDDEEEAKKVHEQLADLIMKEHGGLLENGGEHLGKVLSALAEVYKHEDYSTKETDQKILQIFHKLPREHLARLGPSFSEKQQKKIERMLIAPAA